MQESLPLVVNSTAHYLPSAEKYAHINVHVYIHVCMYMYIKSTNTLELNVHVGCCYTFT